MHNRHILFDSSGKGKQFTENFNPGDECHGDDRPLELQGIYTRIFTDRVKPMQSVLPDYKPETISTTYMKSVI